jgi:hypothetical protein
MARPQMRAFLPLNYVFRLIFSISLMIFFIWLPLQLEDDYEASWWSVFTPLFSILALGLMFTLNHMRQLMKEAQNPSVRRTYIVWTSVQLGLRCITLVGFTLFLIFLTLKLQNGKGDDFNCGWSTVFLPVIVSSGITFLTTIVMFIFQWCDIGSFLPHTERFRNALISETGYHLLFSVTTLVFSYYLSTELDTRKINPVSYWRMFGVFWAVFAIVFIILVYFSVKKCINCMSSSIRKRRQRKKQQKEKEKEEEEEEGGSARNGGLRCAINARRTMSMSGDDVTDEVDVEDDVRRDDDMSDSNMALAESVLLWRPKDRSKEEKRIRVFWVAVIVWIPTCLFLVLLCARLDHAISWKWESIFVPLIVMSALILVYAVTNNGHRVLIDILVEENAQHVFYMPDQPHHRDHRDHLDPTAGGDPGMQAGEETERRKLKVDPIVDGERKPLLHRD